MSDNPIRKRTKQQQSVNKPIRKRTRNTNRPFRKRTRGNRNKTFRSHIRNNAPSSRHTETNEQVNEGTGEGANSIIEYTHLLENDIEVSANDGLFDKIEIRAEHGSVVGLRSEVDLFRRYMGAPLLDDRCEDYSEHHGKLFGNAPDNGRGKKPMKIRSTPLEWGGAILNTPPFEGSLYTTRKTTGRGENSTSSCYLASYLSLNPTRMLNWTAEDLAFNKDNLFNHRPTNQHIRGIDGMDNVIPINQIERSKGDSSKEYIKAVYDLLDFELSKASQAIDGFHLTGDLRTSDFSMRRIETYWEFYSPDAIGLLDQITSTLRMFHKSNHERTHGKQDQAFDLEREKNGKSVKMFLSAGVEIIVYAKTDTRIRFEVVLKPHKQSGLIEGGYTGQTINIVHEKLLRCKEKSASKLNHLLAFLREHREESPKQRANSIHYLSRWFELLGHSEPSIYLLNKLKSTGVIIGGKSLSVDQNKMLRRAGKNNLVYNESSAGGYYPCEVHSSS